MGAEKRIATLSTLANVAGIVGIALTLALSIPGNLSRAQEAAAPQGRPAGTAGGRPGASPSLGKKVFVERCAKCHGEDGSAVLPDGLPLSKRPLTEEQLAKNVNGRLKDRSEEERNAVLEYIKSFRKS